MQLFAMAFDLTGLMATAGFAVAGLLIGARSVKSTKNGKRTRVRDFVVLLGINVILAVVGGIADTFLPSGIGVWFGRAALFGAMFVVGAITGTKTS